MVVGAIVVISRYVLSIYEELWDHFDVPIANWLRIIGVILSVYLIYSAKQTSNSMAQVQLQQCVCDGWV